MKTNNLLPYDNLSELEFIILSILSDKYACAAEIKERLERKDIDFDRSKFYPSLSKLNMFELLCWNWQISEQSLPVKYYFITPKGEKIMKRYLENKIENNKNKRSLYGILLYSLLYSL
jgi:DNA-binding PadR family transcriptional regulator